MRVGANPVDLVRDCLSTVCAPWGWFSRSCGLVADSSSAWLNAVSMRCLLQLAPNARRTAHAQISMVDRIGVVVHPAAQGSS